MSEFFYMDGFAVWVWSAFGVTAVAMIFTAVGVLRRHRGQLRQIAQRHGETSPNEPRD